MGIAKEIMFLTDSIYHQWMTRLTNGLLMLCAFALPFSTTATDLLFPLATLFSLLSGRWAHRAKWATYPISASLVLFFILYLIGSLYSIAPTHDMTHRLLQAACLLWAAILMSHLNTDAWRCRIINAFLLAMVITLVLSYVKYYFIPDLFHKNPEPGSVFKDHIIQNYLMAMAACMFFYRWLQRYRFRWAYGALFLLATYNILFLSLGRSGYFIFAILLLYTCIAYLGWKGLLGAFIALIILGATAYSVSPGFKDRVDTILQNAQQHEQGKDLTPVGIRIRSIENAYELFLQKPWTGYGTGSFATAYANLPPAMIGNIGTVPLSYNHYLNVAVELGLPGLILFLALFALQWRYSFYLKGEPRYLMQILVLGLAFGCLANPWLSDTTELHFYALFLALGFSQRLPILARKTVLSENKT